MGKFEDIKKNIEDTEKDVNDIVENAGMKDFDILKIKIEEAFDLAFDFLKNNREHQYISEEEHLFMTEENLARGFFSTLLNADMRVEREKLKIKHLYKKLKIFFDMFLATEKNIDDEQISILILEINMFAEKVKQEKKFMKNLNVMVNKSLKNVETLCNTILEGFVEDEIISALREEIDSLDTNISREIDILRMLNNNILSIHKIAENIFLLSSLK